MRRQFQFRLQRVLDKKDRHLRSARASLRLLVQDADDTRAKLAQLQLQAERWDGYLHEQEQLARAAGRNSSRTAEDIGEIVRTLQISGLEAAENVRRAEARVAEAKLTTDNLLREITRLEAYRGRLAAQFRREQDDREASEMSETGALMYVRMQQQREFRLRLKQETKS